MTASDEGPRAEALAYIEKTGVDHLLQELCTRVMYHRPADPNAFLLEVLATLQEARDSKTATTFFTAEDIAATFSLLDPTGNGSVSKEQYDVTLRSMGVTAPQVQLPETENDKISKATFLKCVQQQLAKNSVTVFGTSHQQ
jgi:hypothetical protein